MRRRTVQNAITATAVLVAVAATASIAGVGAVSSGGKLTGADIKDGTLGAADLADDSVGSAKIKAGLERRLSGSSNATVLADIKIEAGTAAGDWRNMGSPYGLLVDTVPGELVVGSVDLRLHNGDSFATEDSPRIRCQTRLRAASEVVGGGGGERAMAFVRGEIREQFVVVGQAKSEYAALFLDCLVIGSPLKQTVTGSATLVLESKPATKVEFHRQGSSVFGAS